MTIRSLIKPVARAIIGGLVRLPSAVLPSAGAILDDSGDAILDESGLELLEE